MTIPHFDFDKIIYLTEDSTYQKAVKLYKMGAVHNFRDKGYMYRATVLGSHPYNVSISAINFERGDCDCYMGQNNYVCKHMVALAIYAVLRGDSIPASSTRITSTPLASSKLGEIESPDLIKVKSDISHALKYIKSYNGPSRTWFAYQDSLLEGCKRLAIIVSQLPIGISSAKLIWSLLLRLNKKLVTGGVDDSDGTVGGFVEGCVGVLVAYTKLDPSCRKVFKLPAGFMSSFGWEERLIVQNATDKKLK